jgi:hypothetical protein
MNLTWRKAVRDSRLDTTAKAVAFVLDTYADKNGICWPGLSTIARGAGLNETNRGSVGQAIGRLETARIPPRFTLQARQQEARRSDQHARLEHLPAPDSHRAAPTL